MRNIFRFFLSLVTAIVLFGCSDRLDDYYTAEDLAGLKVHIQLPDYSRALVKTRALDTDKKINSVIVIAYNSDGGFISQQPVTMGTDGKITPSLPSGTATVAVVTNASLTDAQCANLSSTFLDTTPSVSAPVCWGSATVNDLLKSTNPTISLLRMTAKTTVQSSTTDFTVEGIKVYYTAGAGSIAPAKDAFSDDGTLSSVTNKSGESFSATSGDYTSASQVFYETPAGKAFLIVKGKYKDTEGYYKVKLYDQSVTTSNTELQLLRNHNYIVTIKSVNEAGYSTEAGAKAGEAENRMTVTVIDDNPPIVDMISCKDYELGVCAPLTTDGTGGTVNATVVSSYLNGSKVYDYTITGAPDWVTVGTATKTDLPTAAGTDGENSSKGALCVIPLTVKQNPTENVRTATLTVTAGDLTRTITITQAGYDFLADDKRKVLFSIDGTQQSDDYFGTFLPTVNGVKAADNHGLVRDHGLHFAAVKGNTYKYKIPKLTGDSYTTNNDSRIKVTEETNDYLVELADNDDESLWVSNSFYITNASGTKITYPVYHTGVFQNLTSNNQLGTPKTGWFYYGIVEVQGTSGSIYHLLDRNIGATNNGFYSPSTQATKENEGAMGAYMILTKEAIKTTESSSWYVYNAPKGVSSISFILKSVSGADNSKKLTGDVSTSSDVYYKVSGSSASVTNDRPNFKDDGSTISVYVEASSAPYIYVWYTQNGKTEEPNGKWTSTNAMSELSVNTALVGNEFMPSTYFQIPTESYVDDILPKVETRHTKTGEAYYCYVIKTSKTVPSDVQPAEVYIPVTGYYEGTSLRNENHANIWTCTRLSGYQGFSSSSPEFGFWFRYLDCHNSIEEITNMRFVNGSAGLTGSIYNALPVRGIHKE
jgi:hypothetical protein